MRALRLLRKLFLYGLVLTLLGGCAWGVWSWYGQGEQATEFRLEPAVQGPLLVTIDASGTVQPEEVIDVGAQVAGMIKEFGRDPRDSSRQIDYCTPVEEGTVLATLDDSLYRARVRLGEATLTKAQADSAQQRTRLAQTERDLRRLQALRARSAAPEEEYDLALSAYETARDAVLLGEAVVKEAQASLDEAKTNLDYTVIRSPVDGVIIDRRVNVGQTVVASLNAPSLFLIAKDLKRMQVWVSVNEADIGQIAVGQPVTFTVDAFRDTTFKGQVAQIRFNASMTQNVVTYIVVVETDNSSGRLLPYLTANLRFHVHERKDVLQVPNSAIRYRPAPERISPELRAAHDGQRPAGAEGAKGKKKTDVATVWVADGAYARPVKIRVGVSDGKNTEVAAVLEGKLEAGTELITGEVEVQTTDQSVNPFAPPQIFKRRR